MKLLCDTSSVNSTYLSNHTLENITNLPRTAISLLVVNRRSDDKKYIAMRKILMYHSHFDMRPFFEWELKCLPVAVNWFDNVPSFPRPRCEIEMSKLQAIYEFVRDMPVETAEGYFGRNKKVSKKRARS